jgi:hypothetical protein
MTKSPKQNKPRPQKWSATNAHPKFLKKKCQAFFFFAGAEVTMRQLTLQTKEPPYVLMFDKHQPLTSEHNLLVPLSHFLSGYQPAA